MPWGAAGSYGCVGQTACPHGTRRNEGVRSPESDPWPVVGSFSLCDGRRTADRIRSGFFDYGRGKRAICLGRSSQKAADVGSNDLEWTESAGLRRPSLETSAANLRYDSGRNKRPRTILGLPECVCHRGAQVLIDLGSPLDGHRLTVDQGDPRMGRRNQMAIPPGCADGRPCGYSDDHKRATCKPSKPEGARSQHACGAVRAVECDPGRPTIFEGPRHLFQASYGIAGAIPRKRHRFHAVSLETAAHHLSEQTRRHEGAVGVWSVLGMNGHDHEIRGMPTNADEAAGGKLSLEDDTPRTRYPSTVAGDEATPGLSRQISRRGLRTWSPGGLSVRCRLALHRSNP